jgi:rhamnulokinase
MNADYLAFDLGAESGRAMLGHLRSGILELREIHRFTNQPIRDGESLRWDIRALYAQMRRAIGMLDAPLTSMGVDTWGVDYALLDSRGELVENPYHYRDARTNGILDAVFERVSRERIYAVTGIQFLPFNTLCQLFAACRSTPQAIRNAAWLATVPDLLNYWLTGTLVSEYTNATTTQMVDAHTRWWATGLLDELEIPSRLLLPMVEPGAVIGSHSGTPVIAPACHDTGSAFAAVLLPQAAAFLSSGTWSLLGAEVARPVITPLARDSNFTNEGGVCGTTRLLKNITGLWLLQSARRAWAEEGRAFTYDELLAAAEQSGPSRALFDPDSPALLNPPHMPSAIAEECRRSGLPEPSGPAELTRAILESLALKYRLTLELLEQVSQRRFEAIRVVGGGSKNRLLNQLTADATARTVIAGPAEATALGNIAMQMLATGAVSSLEEARRIIDRSFPTERFEPVMSL